MRPVLAGANTYPCPIQLKLLNNFLVQKWAICRKTNINAPLPKPSHNFSTTFPQKNVEMEEMDSWKKIKEENLLQKAS